MKDEPFEKAVREIVAEDAAYAPDAYNFVREALFYTMKLLKKPRTGPDKHVSGAELLEGVRRYALQEFGPMARTVLNTWGIKRCEDIGRVVFKLVEKGILSKRPTDTMKDFEGGYDFDAAFRKPFLPEPAPAKKKKRGGRSLNLEQGGE